MGFLYRYRDVSYTRIRNQLDLTDGNLATHTEKLEDAGYLENRRAWASDGFETRFRISPSGISAFQRYLEEMREFFDEVDN
ncbi:transcriptional regulator [Halostagnicola larsenii]|uniref:transcriptional regulator n=1 Tax=Halostagnicola larsenii TaxID=353800 RepID=UPI00373FDB58